MKTRLFNRIADYTKEARTTINETAYFLKCDPRTVRRLVASGEIFATRIGKTGSYQVLSDTVAAMLLKPLYDAYLDGVDVGKMGIDEGELLIMARRFLPDLPDLPIDAKNRRAIL